MSKNKTILITGAGRGIGLAIAKKLALMGYSLLLTTSSKESAEKLNENAFISENINVFVLNQSDRNAINIFAEKFKQPFLWGIVNNAAICKTFALSEIDNDPFDEILNTNLFGPYFLTKKLLPFIERPGRIINITSQLGHEGRADYSAYCASKFGLIGMTKCWAKELGKEGITVNAISPGWVDTEMSRIDMQRMADEQNIDVKEFYKRICEPLELKRFNSTDEVANLVAFLLSEESSGITGRDWLMQTIWNQL